MIVTRVISLGCTRWTRALVPSVTFYLGRQITCSRLIQLQSASDSNRLRLFTTQTATSSTLGVSNSLPVYCPGCGAPSQSSSKDEAGHYSLTRSAVKAYLGHGRNSLDGKSEEDAIFLSALQDHRKDALHQGFAEAHMKQESEESELPTPICDRCHILIHHNGGTPIDHPSLKSIEDIISSSSFKYNHIYHVIDAADFPMSLISNLTHRLNIASLRNQNRRSKHRQFSGNRSTEVSFIVTRSDLLARKKEQVDSLMPYIRDVLRAALGYRDGKVRLGNITCVSSKRGWYTKDLKESIWQRGGAGWMVGKVNVGKSNLFEAVFPKGRMQMNVSLQTDTVLNSEQNGIATSNQESQLEQKVLESSSQLPPPQTEINYPVMPIISPLPGTTASPIRVPFGNGKGELVDLPGLRRGELEEYVKPELRQSLIMKSRISPERVVIKPNESLLLGSLIRITPATPNLIFIMHPFVNLHPHRTSTDRAAATQSGHRESGIRSVVENNAGSDMASAGKVKLAWDVTRRSAGPLTAKSAVALNPEQLPFIVFGVDVLIEGYGWVEIMAQSRRKAWNEAKAASHKKMDKSWPPSTADDDDIKEDVEAPYPEVEVFSPRGKFIASRKPMCASLLDKKTSPTSTRKRKARPRISMKSVKARRAPGTMTGMSSKVS